MVGFTARFALLAALSSIAALTVLPAPVRGGLVNAPTQDLGPSIAARHSAHGAAIKAAAPNANGDHNVDSNHDRKHPKSSGSKGDTPPDSSGVQDSHSHKPLAPLPSPLAPSPNKAPEKQSRKKGEQTSTHRLEAKEKHSKQAREVYSIDPVTRMRSLWVGGGITVRDVQLETLPPRLDKRHHHHHHHHDHGPNEVVVKGDNDDVHIHRRFVSLISPPDQVNDPGLEPGDVLIEGTNDHVHIHDHDHDGNPGAIMVKGDNDHIRVRRDPMPHHHNTVVVKGDDQHVHVHREPAAHHHHHHHHHPDKVVVNGDNDRVHVHRAPSPHRPRPHHHDSEVVVNGDHDRVHVHRRAPCRRHHRHKAVVEGDPQRLHSGRSPFPEPHHEHHGPDKVVVKGHHDHVDIHRKRLQDYRYPIVIGGNRAKAYLIPQKEPTLHSSAAGTKRHVRRDGVQGVPGTIDVMSQNSNTNATRIASLVLATPSDNSTVVGSPFVLNASDTDRTQMYLVPVSSASTNGTSTSSNSTSSPPAGPPAPPSTDLPVSSPGSTPPTTKSADSDDAGSFASVPVFLQMPIFNAASAKLESYCATFDPRPLSPAPMTVEKCITSPSSDFHKSQVFAYEPKTGYLHPMGYAGDDDGTSDDDSAPSTPSAAPASPPGAPKPPTGPSSGGPPSPPVNSSPPVSNGAAAVTSLEEEALDAEFGDSTHAPIPVPGMFPAEALQNARNVTLKFAPITPEVLPNSGVGKVAELPVVSVPVGLPVPNLIPAPGAGASSSTGDAASSSSATQSASASWSSDADSGATTAAGATSATGTEAGTGTGTTGASATPSDSGAGDSLSAQGLLASATPTRALEVNVYDADASDTTGGPSSSSSSSDLGSSSVAASSATGSTSGTDSGSSTMPAMTQVSTEPYEWMFQGTNASP